MSRKARDSDFPTQGEIAEGLGISLRRVTQLKVEGMPVHSLEAAQAWRSEKSKESGGDLKDQWTQAKIRLTKEQERRIKLENDQTTGKTIPRADCVEAWIRAGAAINSALRAASIEIPRVCLGLTLEQSTPKSKAKMAEIQKIFADAESEFWASHEEVTQ
jgi:phage terminase Nu1 subunit (DNA packaging protein)